MSATQTRSDSVTASDNGKPRRRATAETMAKAQRDISVSEFFAKNRHLLGFDNPRKALLTTVKEAVDNSLDACEESGILPEIWVHIEATETGRYKAGIQDNGPGIVKKQIPLIFGKLLYGSKFHRLRMSRGQQGIGISAAGMYGMLTTGKPVKIISKTSIRKPLHYYEIQIDTQRNRPEILNGKGDGVDIPAGEKGFQYIRDHGIEWETHSMQPPEEIDPLKAAPAEEAARDVADEEAAAETNGHSNRKASRLLFAEMELPADLAGPPLPGFVPGKELRSGTRVTIELEAKYQRGRGSVDEYLEQTAIANPHVTLHYTDPDGNTKHYWRSATVLPPEPQEIKPHPYGVELGRLIHMLKATHETTLARFFGKSFTRVSPGVAKKICEEAGVTVRTHPKRIDRGKADALHKAIQTIKIKAPSTDCIIPIGEELLLKGLRFVVPGEFYAAATRPPGVYRGNPFQVEVTLAYGGAPTSQKVSLDLLKDLLAASDARTLRQFLIFTFNGLGPEAADRILKEAKVGTRVSPGKMKRPEIEKLHAAMHNVNLSEGQSMQVLRYANRVPLQFQHGACAITQAVANMNWRSYGLSQSRGSLPAGPVTVMVHLASVWVPFTSESKEAIASYPEIEKELRLGLQAVGRKLGMYLRRRQRVKAEGQRRNVFLRYLGEVAQAVGDMADLDKDALYQQLLRVAERKTADADVELDESGRPIQEPELDLGDNVLIVQPTGS